MGMFADGRRPRNGIDRGHGGDAFRGSAAIVYYA